MARLEKAFVTRGKQFAHRMIDVAEAIEGCKRSTRLTGRIVDQIVGCGTSVGANLREADEAVSRPDFCRAMGTVLKELGESRFWLELVSERGWIPSRRLTALLGEAEQMSRICSVMVARTRRSIKSTRRRPG
jgi:four helix bundle protein